MMRISKLKDESKKFYKFSVKGEFNLLFKTQEEQNIIFNKIGNFFDKLDKFELD